MEVSAFSEFENQGILRNMETKKPKGKKVKREDGEQITFISLVRSFYPHLSDLVMAIPNGGFRSPQLAALLKLAGVLKGAPDVLVAIPVPNSATPPCRAWVCHGLFIEMKRTQGGKVSKDQERVHRALRDRGYRVEVCEGATQAFEVFEAHVRKAGAAK